MLQNRDVHARLYVGGLGWTCAWLVHGLLPTSMSSFSPTKVPRSLLALGGGGKFLSCSAGFFFYSGCSLEIGFQAFRLPLMGLWGGPGGGVGPGSDQKIRVKDARQKKEEPPPDPRLVCNILG